MSLLLMMGGSDTPSIGSLFANNEAGLAIDVGDRYGASESKRTWRRNLWTYTEQFDNAVWNKGAVTVSANTETSPSGASADTIVEDGTAAYHRISQNFTHVAGTIYTISVEVKLGTGTRFLIVNANTAFGAMASFNLSTGAVHSTTSGTPAIQSLGGGWYRCSITGTATASSTSVTYLQLDNDGTDGTYAGDSSSSIVFGGSQIEVGSLTTYQPISDFNTEFKAAFPTHSLYADSNGVAPSVYPGDQVGLILDTSRGGLDSLGSELNSAFDMSVAGWSTIGAGTTKTASTFTTTAAGGVSISHGQAANPLVNGRAYYVEMSVSCTVSTTFDFRDGGSTVLIPAVSVGTTPVTLKGIANITNTLGMYLRGNAAGTYTIHSFSIKQIPGNHAYQTTSGSRPALARTPDGGRRNLLVYSEALSNAAWSQGSSTNGTAVAGVLTVTNNEGFTYFVQAGTFSTTTDHVVTFDVTCDQTVANVPLRLGGTVSVSQLVNLTAGVTLRVTFTGYRPFTGSGAIQIGLDLRDAVVSGGSNTTGYTITLNRVQLETGSSATAYQKVGLTSDVTESGKRDCWGLLFDGSDDSLQTSEISFNTWTQATRRNLLTDTESFGVAGWVKTSTTVTDNTVISPDGTTTADSLNGSGAGSLSRVVYQNITRAVPATFSVYAKKGTSDFIQLLTDQANNGFVNFDLNNGTLSATTATGTITDVGNGWYRCSMAITSGSTFGNIYIGLVTSNSAARYEANTLTTTVYLWGAQLEAGTLTDYQRVGTDKMTVMAGVRKNSDASRGIVAELGTGNGRFVLEAPDFSVTSVYRFSSVGTAAGNAVASGFAAPITTVITGQGNIGGDVTQIRANGAIAQTDSTDQGTGNYANAAISIGQRIGNSFRFNGLIYTLIVRGATTPTGTIADFEKNLLRLRAGLGPF
jgi:hypothetical protein